MYYEVITPPGDVIIDSFFGVRCSFNFGKHEL